MSHFTWTCYDFLKVEHPFKIKMKGASIYSKDPVKLPKYVECTI